MGLLIIMEKLIIYFDPQNKKIQLNQFHVEADKISDGIELLKANGGKGYKILGTRNYPKAQESNFINLKFY